MAEKSWDGWPDLLLGLVLLAKAGGWAWCFWLKQRQGRAGPHVCGVHPGGLPEEGAVSSMSEDDLAFMCAERR